MELSFEDLLPIFFMARRDDMRAKKVEIPAVDKTDKLQMGD